MKFLLRRGECKTRENSIFKKKKGKNHNFGKKIQNLFFRSRMTKRISPLESSVKSSNHVEFRLIMRQSEFAHFSRHRVLGAFKRLLM